MVVTASGYRLEEQNRLTTDPTNPANSVQRGEVTVKGLELEANATVASWDLVTSYTYTDAIVSASSDPLDPYLGKRLHSIPEHSASIWGVHSFTLAGVPGFRAGAGVRFIGRTTDGQDLLTVPSNTLVDALISFDVGRWRYALNASNLLDRIYIATCIDRGDCWYGSRRRVIGTLSRRWG